MKCERAGLKTAKTGLGKNGSDDRALVGALVGAGLCVPAILAASQMMPVALLPALGFLTGGSALGCGLAMLTGKVRSSQDALSEEIASTLPRSIMRPASELVLRHDKNGDVLAHSGSAHELLGQFADTVFGKGLLNRIRISDRPAYLKAVSDAAHGRSSQVVHLQLAVDQMQHCYRAFAFSARPCEEGCESSLRDISRELELEQALTNAPAADAAEEQIAKAASHVAHELRSPLNSILGFSELLAGDDVARFDEAQRKEYAELIHQSGTHLLGVVDNMLDMGRLKAGRLELSQNSFDVSLLCQVSVSLVEPQTRETALEIDIDCPHDLPPLYADEKCCQQMLINLLGNAIKFTSGAGKVSLTARQTKGHVEFEVKDTGIGIPDEALARLGRPFERVEDNMVPGTGLGLSLVRQMVALHGGSFKLESVLGEGTTATLSLPVVRAALDEPAAAVAPAESQQELTSGLADYSAGQRRIA